MEVILRAACNAEKKKLGRSGSGDWIPKDTLAAANVFAGASWVVMLWLALRGAEPGSLSSLGWVHVVALGWITVASLSVLLHVIAAFLDVEWFGQDVARWALRIFAVGVALLVAAFLLEDRAQIEGAALLTFAALCVYLTPTCITIGRALRGERLERMVASAFLITLAFLLVTGALGAAFGLALKGRLNPLILSALPQAHGVLGIAGWLTSLVFGVSARTMRAITGVKSRIAVAHVATSGLLLLGAIFFAIAMANGSSTLALAGIVLMCFGALFYAVDLFDILLRRQHPNPVPQMYVIIADVWLVACVALGAGVAAGKPWGAALTYLALVGWLGQMVNGHIHHIGVRLMITAVWSDDDETRPWTVVSKPLGTASWALSQIAVALGTLALAAGEGGTPLVIAACCGIAGWLSMVLTLFLAYQRVLKKTIVIHAA